jgi:WD40 repeat protein
VYAVAVGALPDGTPVIVSGGSDRTVRVWRLTDRILSRNRLRRILKAVRVWLADGTPLRGHDDWVRAVAVGALPDGTLVIVSGSDDRTVRVWRLTDGTPIRSPLDLQAPVSAVAMTGELIVAATMNDVVAIDLDQVRSLN